jgi:hypothetical protein
LDKLETPVLHEDPEGVGGVEGVAEVHRVVVAQLVVEEETEEEGVELEETLAVVETLAVLDPVPLELTVLLSHTVEMKLALLDTEKDCNGLNVRVTVLHEVEDWQAVTHWEANADAVGLADGQIDKVGVKDPVGQLVRDGDGVELGVELLLIERVGDTESVVVGQIDTDGEVVGVKDTLVVGQEEEEVLEEVLRDTEEQPDTDVE